MAALERSQSSIQTLPHSLTHCSAEAVAKENFTHE